MVAAEKMARAQAETRSKQAEENLAAAEAAMRDMQTHLQSLPTLLPAADVSAQGSVLSRNYLAAHIPHTEFIAFIGHIRALKPQYIFPGHSTPSPPSVAMLNAQAFVLRANSEDVEPTLRLDVAPDLGWMNRKGVQNAIISGELIIEPISAASLLSHSAYASHSGEIGCAMCGKPVFARSASSQESLPPPVHPAASRATSNSRFSLKPFFNSPSAPSPSASPSSSPNPNSSSPSGPPVFIFRINLATSQSSEKEKESMGRIYPLCATGWCLGRLRSVCEWWRFLRTGIIEVIWKGEDGWVPAQRQNLINSASAARSSFGGSEKSVPTTPAPVVADETSVEEEKPELPPRKKTGWGLGFKGLGSGKGLGLGKGETPPASPSVEKSATEAGLEGEKSAGDSRPASARSTSNASNADEGKEQAPNADVTKAEETVSVVVSEPADTVAQNEQSETRRSSLSAESDGESGVHAFATPINGTPSRSLVDLPATNEAKDDLNNAKENGAEGAASTDVANASTAPLDLSSPRPSTDITAVVRTSLETGRPPPTPPRSAARRAVPAPPGSPAPPPLPVRNKSRPTSLVTPNENTPTRGDSFKSPVLPSTPDVDIPITPEPANSATPVAVLQKPPMRNTGQRASLVPGTSAPTSTGKRFVEGDAWEAKTWREVIRLKEDMWKARVGVTEGDA